ncbi:hypothetical protein I6M90_04820 [Acinetobacter bereziniae]|uniref:hypothetical protein n=1 Tax=Acinetobacter bereziniae TaxID=106648 RepID=UPI001902A926|nr:hypothetical protein [Acinetobacter bereziniae]MBJ8450878.1 hypothetical protein [Acinetobacter bereziniae]MBJ8455394.1 hypothetical protein [Acinetobacter bereziniae]
MDWFFSGLGTAIVTFIFGTLIGGTAGYKIAIKKNTIRQNQRAGDNSSQIQVGRDYK